MLVQVNDKLGEARIANLLEAAVQYDDDQLERVYKLYSDPSLQHELYVFEIEGEWVGIVGCQLSDSGDLNIIHLAVDPEHRGYGYGRGILLELLAKKHPSRLVAVTDEHGADFFRNVGFEIVGSPLPPEAGSMAEEMFSCMYEVYEVDETGTEA